MVRVCGDLNSFPFSPGFLHLDYPESASGGACHQEEHAQDRNQLQRQCYRSKPRVFHLSLCDILLSFLSAQPTQLEVSPVMERARSVASNQEEDRNPDNRDQVHGQEENEFDNLSQTEGTVDGTSRWLP